MRGFTDFLRLGWVGSTEQRLCKDSRASRWLTDGRGPVKDDISDRWLPSIALLGMHIRCRTLVEDKLTYAQWYLREYIYYINGSSTNFETLDMTNHVPHCIEAVRIALTCFLDPTLIPLGEWPGIPNGYQHECRNREAMYHWAQENGHDIPAA